MLRNIQVTGIIPKGVVWSSLARNSVGYVLTRWLRMNKGLDLKIFINIVIYCRTHFLTTVNHPYSRENRIVTHVKFSYGQKIVYLDNQGKKKGSISHPSSRSISFLHER